MKKRVRLNEKDLQIIVKKVLVESKVDKSIDNILNSLILDTEFGWGGMGLTPYIIFPWDGENRSFIKERNYDDGTESIQLKGGYLRRDYGGPNYDSEISEMYGITKDESDILWGKYSTITIKMINDFLDIYSDDSRAVFGDDGNTIIDSTTPEVKYFSQNYLGSSDVPIEVYDEEEVEVPNEEDDFDDIDVEELYDSLGTVLGLATTMCNDYENETYDTLDPHEALDCLYEIDTPRAHKLIEMIKFYEDELDSMDAEEDYRDDDEFMDEYGIDESKVIKLKESDLHRIVNKVISEQSLFAKLGFISPIDYSKIENLSNAKEIANAILTGMCFDVDGESAGMRNALCNDKEAKVGAAFQALANNPKIYVEVEDSVRTTIGFKNNLSLLDIVGKNIDINKVYHKVSIKDSYDIIMKNKPIKLKESDLHKIVKRVLNENFSDDKESLIFKVLRRLKGVSKDQLEYNMKNDLPWDWRGSKEGFYEKMEPRKNYTGSN